MSISRKRKLLESVANPAALPAHKVLEAQAILDKALGLDQDAIDGAVSETAPPILVPLGIPDLKTGDYRRGLMFAEYVTFVAEKPDAGPMTVNNQSITIPQTEVFTPSGSIVVAWTLEQVFDALYPPELEDEPQPAPAAAPKNKK